METEADIIKLVKKLPEIYQPIIHHPQFDNLASRNCYDRWIHVEKVATQLRQQLGRPLRVLDLGCAQGFFSLKLALAGDEVIGIDRETANIALCMRLAQHVNRQLYFIQADFVAWLTKYSGEQFDLVLMFSILHHLCYEQGLPAACQAIATISAQTKVLLIETARHDEPPRWAKAQPKNPRQFLQHFAYVEKIAEHGTHLSTLTRPTFFCSNLFWYANGEMAPFDSWSTISHELVDYDQENHRAYYFNQTQLLKYFLFAGKKAQCNREELQNEINFLRDNPELLQPKSHLIKYQLTATEGWLLKEKIAGIRLASIILQRQAYDAKAIITAVLAQLVQLESAGYYHSDLRTWNVIVAPNGGVSLIDFGSITRIPHDILSPNKNIYLSFLIFFHELISRKLVNDRHFNPQVIATENYPEEYHLFLFNILISPPETWSFKQFATLLNQPTVLTIGQQQNLVNLLAWSKKMQKQLDKKRLKLKKFEPLFLRKLQQLQHKNGKMERHSLWQRIFR